MIIGSASYDPEHGISRYIRKMEGKVIRIDGETVIVKRANGIDNTLYRFHQNQCELI